MAIRSLQERFALGIATGGGIGFFSAMPGTLASVIAALPIMLFPGLKIWILPALILLILFSPKAIAIAEQQYGEDASVIVVDEIIGMWIAQISPFMPTLWIWHIVALGIFRYLDIRKPGYIGTLNARKGAFFVIADDILAGIYTAFIIHASIFVVQLLALIKILF